MIQAPRGTKDFFGVEIKRLHKLEAIIREVCDAFGVEEIRTPIFEHTELFERGVGETTDIVQKEMYTFTDKGNRSITLRPEGTAGVVRAYLEHKLYTDGMLRKLYYNAPSFRYEKPQAGRYRQLTQFGIEYYGSYGAACDAEVISVGHTLINKLGIKNIELRINSLGGTECRKKYNEAIKAYIGDNLEMLCPQCRERFDKNPLRVLDCKSEGCKKVMADAPSSIDSLDTECREHFELLKTTLTDMGIPFIVDKNIVRGLDYYTRTVFEFVSSDIGAQATVCAGGRYDRLVEECGGSATGAVGFGMGIERMLMTMESQGIDLADEKKRDIYVGYVGDRGFAHSQVAVLDLRKNGIAADGDTTNKSVKAQLKYANKLGSKYSCVIGDQEIDNDLVSVKNMETGETTDIQLSNMHKGIKKLIGVE